MGSYDADGDPPTYRWSFVHLAKGSTAFLANEDQVNPSLTVDKFGRYRIKLIVNDVEQAWRTEHEPFL